MANTTKDYDYIVKKIHSLRSSYPFLKSQADVCVFSALCIKAHFYGNPALSLIDNELEDMIIDGSYDGGVDFLLTDPSSESGDIVIGQSKFYKSIKHEEVLNALIKMANFYKDMSIGHFEKVNSRVQKRFLTLTSELGSESRIIFVFCTSAPKSKISVDSLEKKFHELFANESNIDLCILFASDIVSELREAESRRPTVETGEIIIDKAGNILDYGDEAIIVNASAMSIKRLYSMHGNNLLAKNLRYHITYRKFGMNVDKEIDETINTAPDLFWMRNNGITIICDSFCADENRVKLANFSVINGGQTIYILKKNKKLDEDNDFFLQCKIIRARGQTEDEKNTYILEIARAVNSQKPIQPIDLKANSPEQVRFIQAMRDVGVFYQTKRGEKPPKEYNVAYKNTDLAEIGKLCLCAIFQMPAASRTKPSLMYAPDYYSVIFGGDQIQTAKICRELLYIDYYFRNIFIKKYDSNNSSSIMDKERIQLARNSRTICIAFVAFASRYCQGNITDEIVSCMKLAVTSSPALDKLHKLLSKIDGLDYILPNAMFLQKEYDRILDKLFYTIIEFGCTVYNFAQKNDPTITASNFLKDDRRYYEIISFQWPLIKSKIKEIFYDIDFTPSQPEN